MAKLSISWANIIDVDKILISALLFIFCNFARVLSMLLRMWRAYQLDGKKMDVKIKYEFFSLLTQLNQDVTIWLSVLYPIVCTANCANSKSAVICQPMKFTNCHNVCFIISCWRVICNTCCLVFVINLSILFEPWITSQYYRNILLSLSIQS